MRVFGRQEGLLGVYVFVPDLVAATAARIVGVAPDAADVD